jgi:hypothetical protein
MELNWAKEFIPGTNNLAETYLRCLYAVINITTSVGSGDNYAITDAERIFFICMMTLGDIVFGLAFGAVAEVFLNFKKNNPANNFID